MVRADWQQIAEERLLATQSLLGGRNWASAYYLAGYAVECGLKSCILARVAAAPEMIFIEKRFSEKCWTHDINELTELAGLKTARVAAALVNGPFGQNWEIVKDWTEKSRYEMNTQSEAEALYDAITDNANGVMQWIRARW